MHRNGKAFIKKGAKPESKGEHGRFLGRGKRWGLGRGRGKRLFPKKGVSLPLPRK
jgi:hypothetical protein